MSQNLLTWADGIIKEAAGGGDLFKDFKTLVGLVGRDSQQAQQAAKFIADHSWKQLKNALSTDKNLLKQNSNVEGAYYLLSPRQQAAAQAYRNRIKALQAELPEDMRQPSELVKEHGGEYMIAPKAGFIRGDSPSHMQELIGGLQTLKKSRPWVQAEEARKKQQVDELMKHFR